MSQFTKAIIKSYMSQLQSRLFSDDQNLQYWAVQKNQNNTTQQITISYYLNYMTQDYTTC